MVEIISKPSVKKWRVMCLCGCELKYSKADEYTETDSKIINHYIYCPYCKSKCYTRILEADLTVDYMTGNMEHKMITDYRSSPFYEEG